MHKIQKRAVPVHFLNWKASFLRNYGREPVYEDFIKTGEYIALKKELLEEQGYICCYCEKEIGVHGQNDCDIEHFMPRHPDRRFLSVQECAICRQAQLDYNNLLVSCKGNEKYSLDHCNHKKGNWFDFRYCISPVSGKTETMFGFRLSGKIFARDNDRGAEEMKNQLNLDTYVLREQRKKAYDAVLEAEFDEEELLEDEAYVQDTIAEYREKDENGRYVPFCSMITYCLANYF